MYKNIRDSLKTTVQINSQNSCDSSYYSFHFEFFLVDVFFFILFYKETSVSKDCRPCSDIALSSV